MIRIECEKHDEIVFKKTGCLVLRHEKKENEDGFLGSMVVEICYANDVMIYLIFPWSQADCTRRSKKSSIYLITYLFIHSLVISLFNSE